MSVSLFRLIRRGAYSILTLPPVNWLGRSVLSIIPSTTLYKSRYVFPIRGEARVRYGGGQDFSMYTNGSDTIASRAFFGGALGFEEETSKILTGYFNEGGTFFDVGANTGIYTLMAATFPQVKSIHSFEPMSNAFEILKTNIEKNHFTNVQANKLALGDRMGKLELAVPRGIMLPTGSSLKGSNKFDSGEGLNLESVQITTLDDYVEKNGIESCDLIKIDTETTEPAVLRGALKTIMRFRPKIVCEVIREQAAREITELLKQVNYKFFHLTPEGPTSLPALKPDLMYMNFLFLPQEQSH